MRAADCPRTFTLLAEGGVRVTWGCGAEFTDRKEVAVDVEALRGRMPDHHHHVLHHLPHRQRRH